LRFLCGHWLYAEFRDDLHRQCGHRRYHLLLCDDCGGSEWRKRLLQSCSGYDSSAVALLLKVVPFPNRREGECFRSLRRRALRSKFKLSHSPYSLI
jgi:hypothetical protein